MISTPVATNPRDVYTDINGLQRINELGRENKDAALRQVAEQFESMFVKMMMKSMRDANAVFQKDSLFHSQEEQFYQQMYDDQLAVTMSSSSSLGLADVIYRQLSNEYGDPEARKDVQWQSIDERRKTFAPEIRNIPVNSSEETEVSNTEKQSAFSSPEAFVKAVYPAAEKIAQEMGVNPLAIVSQAALETGWGQYMITDEKGRNSFNFFGIKADQRWSGDSVSIQTHEYREGVRVNEKADFRAYESIDEALSDYKQFLGADRYQNALKAGDDISRYAQELQKAGYATDPQYADKIIRIAQGDIIRSAVEVPDG